MNAKLQLPPAVESYLGTINGRDATAFESVFAPDAVVKDIAREIRGIGAIAEWARQEIFGVNVTMELLTAAEHEGRTTITVKIDGTFDRTGLPDPLVMEHSFTVADGKITTLTCKLAN